MSMLVAAPLLASLVAIGALAEGTQKSIAELDSELLESEQFVGLSLTHAGLKVEFLYFDSIMSAVDIDDGEVQQTVSMIDSVAGATVRGAGDLFYTSAELRPFNEYQRELWNRVGEMRPRMAKVVAARDTEAWRELSLEVVELQFDIYEVVDELLSRGGAGRHLLYDQTVHLETLVVETAAVLAAATSSSEDPDGVMRTALIAAAEVERTFSHMIRFMTEEERERMELALVRSGALQSVSDLIDGDAPTTTAEQLNFVARMTEYAQIVGIFNEQQYADLLEEITEERSAAQFRLWLMIAASGALVMVSVGTVVIVGGRTSRRVERLALAAERMSEGEFSLRRPPGDGADEFSVLERSLYDLSRTIEVGQRQVTALAEGAYDDPIFDRELPGLIGRSLQQALRDLSDNAVALDHDARHDPLTGLVNRRGLEQSLEGGTSDPPVDWAMIMVDLDGFKAVNDHFGHPAGDAVLVGVSERLQKVARPDDIVARLGGDEFLVCIRDPSPTTAAAMVERVRRAAEEPVAWGTGELRVAASIGWCTTDQAGSSEAALAEADRTMYQSKHRRQLESSA